MTLSWSDLNTKQINEIIVYVSLAILVVSAFSCIVMFMLRAKKKRDPTDDGKVVENISEDNASKAKTKTLKGTKKKTKKSKKSHPDDASQSSYESASHASSETTSLLADSHNEQKAQLHAGTMNKALRATFNSVLSEGLTLILHSDQPIMQVKMALSGSELRWRSKKMFSTKSYKLQLKQIMFIEWGKQTANFKRPTAKDAKSDSCFSLVTENTTYDFETSSKVERDALVQGFMLAIADHKEANSSKV